MVSSPEVLIVAHADDGVAVRVRQALEKRGQAVAHLDGTAAARRLTIHVKPGATAVTPALPMFVRPSAWWCDRQIEDPDERFLRAEAYAAFWAAAALCPAPVINRPGPQGFVQRMTWGMLATALHWPPQEGSEIHASGP